MTPHSKDIKQAGFTIIDTLVAFTIILTLAGLICSVAVNQQKMRALSQTGTTFDRIFSGVRSLAGNPAALRNSMRALSADGSTVVNPELLACAGGTPANNCTSQIDYPFTLYSPLINMSSGSPSVQAITSPMNSTTPSRFDAWGAPCPAGNTTCPLLVFTSFRAQCGPNQQVSQAVGTLTPAMLLPLNTCTVAEAIDVTYSIQLDPNLTASTPGLAAFSVPVTGVIATSVVAISGDQPQ